MLTLYRQFKHLNQTKSSPQKNHTNVKCWRSAGNSNISIKRSFHHKRLVQIFHFDRPSNTDSDKFLLHLIVAHFRQAKQVPVSLILQQCLMPLL